MGCGGPVDAGLDIAKGMPRRKRGILLIHIDQRLDFVDARRAPALLPADSFGGASGDGTFPHIENVIRLPLPDQTARRIFHRLAIQHQDEP